MGGSGRGSGGSRRFPCRRNVPLGALSGDSEKFPDTFARGHEKFPERVQVGRLNLARVAVDQQLADHAKAKYQAERGTFCGLAVSLGGAQQVPMAAQQSAKAREWGVKVVAHGCTPAA